MRVLVIEDSSRLRRYLGEGLKKMGFVVDVVGEGQEGLDYARSGSYDAIVLDLMLPGLDGWTLLRRLRASGNKTHVLILSARDTVDDRVRGLDAGADDYLVKPFSLDELRARLNTLQRRSFAAKDPDIAMGSITLNTSTRQVRVHDKPLELTPGEYAVLERLALNRSRVLSKEQLLDGTDSCAGTNMIEVIICNLRKKMGHTADDPVIRTRRGYGYYIE